ncbi:hypothetical protein BKA56DRAFT_605453, partial [Ilyonectria sp. MPI-CAGE-AT-0026]
MCFSITCWLFSHYVQWLRCHMPTQCVKPDTAILPNRRHRNFPGASVALYQAFLHQA